MGHLIHIDGLIATHREVMTASTVTPILSANMSDMVSRYRSDRPPGTIAQVAACTPAKITPKPARALDQEGWAAVKLKKPGGPGSVNLHHRLAAANVAIG